MSDEPVKKPTPARGAVFFAPVRSLFGLLIPDEPPLELQVVGRTFLQAALVGLLAGLVGSAFLIALDWVQGLLLEQAAGYEPLRAAGEQVAQSGNVLRWWLVLLLPGIGGAACGLLALLAPETRGGGGDASIRAFHYERGVVRRRVLLIKPLASIASLGTGGAGGREGPTMLIGAAIGSTVGRYLSLGARERRILMVAGVAGGISAVFRTPLGAALLAIEFLYRDDFESEALIPAVLSSVIAYSVALSVFGTKPLFGVLPHYAFEPRQLPLFIGLALVIVLGAKLFEGALELSHSLFAKMPGPAWMRPAVGGLLLGGFAVALLFTVGPWFEHGHRGLGVLGGGYGAGQLAITQPTWIEAGWPTVRLLLVLAAAKIVAASLTIGSGGSAGDFAPSIAIGGLLGGAFGGAAQLLLHDPAIQPGAFALVGMAAFYAGIGKVPLAALVMVCEVAGSYDLLVPLMLTEALALIALRRVMLYKSQPRTMKDSPVHGLLTQRVRCGDVVDRGRPHVALSPKQTIDAVAAMIEIAENQDVFPVLDEGNKLVGLLSAEGMRAFISNHDARDIAIVADIMVAPLTLAANDDIRTAAVALVSRDLRAAPVVDDHGAILGMLDQHDLVALLTAPPPDADASASSIPH